MSGDFRVILDDAEMARYLASLDEKGVTKILRSASLRGAGVYRTAMRPEIPVKKSGGAQGRGYGTPGDMRASVGARRIKSNPAIGYVVGPMGRRAFMRKWVTFGTKEHDIRPKGAGGFLRVGLGFTKLVHHPGIKTPNDYAGRTQAKAEGKAFDKAEAYLLKEATK